VSIVCRALLLVAKDLVSFGDRLESISVTASAVRVALESERFELLLDFVWGSGSTNAENVVEGLGRVAREEASRDGRLVSSNSAKYERDDL
jgi:hypothetical protein